MAAPAAPGGMKLGSLATLTTPVKVAVCLIVPALFGLLYYVIFYNDLTTKIDQATRQQAALRSDLSTQQQAQASYLADRDELALREQRQREFNKVLPTTSEAAAFLSAIQQVSNVSGIDLGSWRPEPESQEQYYAKVPMRLELTGRYHQVLKFAHELGKVDRIINLEDIEMHKSTAKKVVAGNDDEAQMIKVRCLATAFKALQQQPTEKRR